MINKVFDYVKYEYEYAKTTLKRTILGVLLSK